MFKKGTALLFIVIVSSISIPLGWKKVKGPGIRQFSKNLLEEKEPLLQEDVLFALAQPYFYWNKGSQCYVFLSQDERFVLKIPRKKKEKEAVKSFKIASSVLLSETALLWVHYGREHFHLPDAFALYDQLNRQVKIDLACHPFALQHRTPLLKNALELANNQEEEKKLLCQFLHLVEIERRKGWYATDYAFSANIGLENQEAVRIDIGSYTPVDSQFSWRKVAKPVCRYLQRKDSILSLWFEERIQEYEKNE